MVTLTSLRVMINSNFVIVCYRKGREGVLEVDNASLDEGTSQGLLMSLNVAGNIYLGESPTPCSVFAERKERITTKG